MPDFIIDRRRPRYQQVAFGVCQANARNSELFVVGRYFFFIMSNETVWRRGKVLSTSVRLDRISPPVFTKSFFTGRTRIAHD